MIDKPAGWSSQEAVTVTRRALGRKRAGHTGTLDPFATGLLVVLTDRATRLARFIESEAKCYQAEITLGMATTTDDPTGKVIATRTPNDWPSRETVLDAVQGMVGTVMQVPPSFSAKHVDGVRSYQLAREGQAVALASAEVVIHQLTVTGWSPERIELEAVVGKGTYLRAVARDLGERLGIPAHCSMLRRTGVGNFRVDQAVDPRNATADRLLSPREMLAHLPTETVAADAARDLSYGKRILRQGAAEGITAILAEADGRLVAVATAEGELWRPLVVLEEAG